MKSMRTLLLPSLVCAALLSSACAGRKPFSRKKEPIKPAAERDAGLTLPAIDVTEASLRGSEFVESAALAPIYFDYDSFSLKETTLSALKKNAEYLKQHRDLEVLVSGHCDERGTVEYNLALGQKRAKEVREYYIRLGVSGKAIATISYGEEKPACSEATEECWLKNRRALTGIRARTASNGLPPAPAQ